MMPQISQDPVCEMYKNLQGKAGEDCVCRAVIVGGPD